jgi:hypothetical protein
MFFLAWEEYHNFYLAFWAPFAFCEADFHKIKGRGALSRSRQDLNTLDSNEELTESCSTSAELRDEHGEFKMFVCFWNFCRFFIYLLFFGLCQVKTAQNKSVSEVGLLYSFGKNELHRLCDLSNLFLWGQAVFLCAPAMALRCDFVKSL